VESPTEGLRVLLAQAITVTCRQSGMIACPVALDGEGETASLMAMLAARSIRSPDTPHEGGLDALRPKGVEDAVFKRVHLDRGRTLPGDAVWRSG